MNSVIGIDGTTKTGISIPKNVLERLDKIMEKTGAKSRSKVITTAVINYLDEIEKLMDTTANVVAVITYTYDHHRGDTVKNLLSIQHDYLDAILFTTHVHISKHKCLETLVVKGATGEILNLIAKLENIKGVEALKYNIVRP